MPEHGLETPVTYFMEEVKLSLTNLNYHRIAMAKLALTYWAWMTHICVRKLTIIGTDNGLAPGRGQAAI